MAAKKSLITEKKTGFSLSGAAGAFSFDKTPAVPTAPEKKEKDYIRFSFICNSELAQKVRAVSTKENVTVRQIMEKAVNDWLAKYEKKNGPVGAVKARSVEDL